MTPIAAYEGESGRDREVCGRCRCCSAEWVDCEMCGGDGIDGHDCGEDTCCCADPEDNVSCQFCEGVGIFPVCGGGCDENGKHAA